MTLACLYRYGRLLSLDVALGGGILAERVMGVRMPWAWYLVLPAAVWCVYTLDHLLDARRVGPGASTPRHRFHHRHARGLTAACGIVGGAAGVLAVTQLQPMSVWLGIGLSIATLAHLALTEGVGSRASPLLMKELGVGVIFTAGIWGLPAVHHGLALAGSTWLMMVQYLLLALVNLVEFSWYEHHLDVIDGHTSFVRGIGPQRVPMLAAGMLAVVVVLGLAAAGLRPMPRVFLAQAIYMGMAGVLGLLAARPGWFAEDERYRIWGDGAFLLPWLMLLAG